MQIEITQHQIATCNDCNRTQLLFHPEDLETCYCGSYDNFTLKDAEDGDYMQFIPF